MLRLILGASLCLWVGFGLNAHPEHFPNLPNIPAPAPEPEPLIQCQDQEIEMIPYSHRLGFDDVAKVTLHLFCVDNAYGRMVLDYEAEGVLTSKELTMSDTYTDSSCGHRHYFGSLASTSEDGYRFSVRLTDLDSEECYDMPFRWTAEVRSGFGWCGTMDSVMTLIEKPAASSWGMHL